jgi:hypothetical protein
MAGRRGTKWSIPAIHNLGVYGWPTRPAAGTSPAFGPVGHDDFGLIDTIHPTFIAARKHLRDLQTIETPAITGGYSVD